jgi:hypothetical protein
VSALPGGAAAKLGDRYEGWWTLLRVADVLQGKASRIRLEPPLAEVSASNSGRTSPGARWCEQVKNTEKPWTLRRLCRDVLPPLLGHLRNGYLVKIVSSSDILEIGSRARAAETLTQYRDILTARDLPSFEWLATEWEVSEDQAWFFLRQVHVEHHSAASLRRLVHTTYELLLQGDPELVVNELRSWLDDLLHETWTGPMVWRRLAEKGYRRRLLAGDPGTSATLTSTVDRHRRRVEGNLPDFGLVAQPLVDQLVERIGGSERVLWWTA